MKKIFKGLMCAGLAGALAFGFVGAAGCKKDSGSRNPETDPLRLAIGPVDEKFNPLYFTSQNDGTIASLTQVSLITTDANGNFAVGDNYPTVALDYVETYYDADGTKIATGDGEKVDYVDKNNPAVDVDGSTTYEFLIKKGMKFSDGTDLTVVDVLFNLYVYLDPLYNGSNTIYSTKIKGLQAYRQNDPNADEDSEGSTTSEYRLKAEARLNRLIEWSDPNFSSSEEIPADDPDLLKVKSLYEEELNSDWNSTVASWVENYKEYYFTEAWQAFYFAEGAVTEQTRKNSNGVDVRFKDNNGKYPTTLDPQVISFDEATGEIELGEISQGGQLLISEMEAATTEAKIDEYLAKPENSGINRENAKLTLQKEHAIKYLINANIRQGALHNVLRFNVTASTAYEYFLQDEMSKAITEQNVENISGITVSHTADGDYNNQFNGKTYAEDHDVLKIEINGVDPKAKWNFGFTVAPMHYYSGTYGGVNYVKLAMDDYNNRYNLDCFYKGKAKNFGVKYSDINFTTDVLAAAGKNGVPMGAGPYKCTTYDYGKSSLNSRTFFRNYMAYFERNSNFTTMGANVENAKIKYVTYRVTSDDKIVNALKTGEIDYGEPTAKATNQSELAGFRQITYQTGGYGYVGINPKYVPNITIRRAIMKAFNPNVMYDYYGEGLVNIISRPMTATSWVWDEPYECTEKLTSPYYEEAASAQDIIDFIVADSASTSEKWTWDGSNWRLNGAIQSLKYKFTIAGESNDHPAYQMFVLAKELLEDAGFDIEVGNDPKALQKLVTGDLQVWAAAWSSSIDPDPYQVYSIYSNASSTKNWYKDGILDNRDKFPTEYAIAMELNDKITEGRQSIVRFDRAQTYAGEDGCLDLIMELAVEFPTYQRYDLCVFNDSILDRSTMTERPSHHMGLIDELWKLNYVQ